MPGTASLLLHWKAARCSKVYVGRRRILHVYPQMWQFTNLGTHLGMLVLASCIPSRPRPPTLDDCIISGARTMTHPRHSHFMYQASSERSKYTIIEMRYGRQISGESSPDRVGNGTSMFRVSPTTDLAVWNHAQQRIRI